MDAWLSDKETIRKSKRYYAHFDVKTDIGHVKDYVSNPQCVAMHGFYPFIHYEMDMSKFNKEKGQVPKTRDICYAAHIDRCIYQYYSHILNELYNERTISDGISDVAVAYRTNLRKSNIQFSKAAYDFIRKTENCYVMIGDFTHFFDNLDHAYLKKQWCSLLGCERLPKDHYNVFKNITSFSQWELTDLLKINALKDNKAGHRALNKQSRVLTAEQYKNNRSHIQPNRNHYGIPQGSPISGMLANLYMLEVDRQIHDLIEQYKGFYMRYSDDFIVVLPDRPDGQVLNVFSEVREFIASAPRLILEPSKTQYFRYVEKEVENIGKAISKDADDSKKFINFLGFSFDGKKVFIRSKTTAKYYYRMYRKAKNIAKTGGYTRKGNHINLSGLYTLYSEHGAKSKRGNYFTYIEHAEEEYGQDEEIRHDLKNNMGKIRKVLKGI